MKYGAVTTITCQMTNQTDSDTYSNVATAAHSVIMVRTRVCTTSTACTNGNTVDAESVTGLTDATGAVSFTITGPANPLLAGADKYVDTVVLTATNITAGLSPLTAIAGHMSPAATTLTFGLEYLDTDVASDVASSTQTSTSSLAATASVTRSVSHTSHDQFGDTVAGEVITFTSVNTLHQGALCVSGDEICTLAAHGLSVGDDITILSLGNGRGDPAVTGTSMANGLSYVVLAVGTVNTFTLEDAAGNDVDITTTGIAATPMTFTTTSFASATRTTNASGVATFSWADTESTSNKDVVTSDGATGGAATATHFRLAAPADFSSDVSDGTIANGEEAALLVEFDAVGKDFILQHVDGTVATHSTTKYMQYSYDSNDHFAIGGTSSALNGTAATETVWVTRMGTICALTCATGGTNNDVVYVNGYTGLSTTIVRFSSDS